MDSNEYFRCVDECIDINCSNTINNTITTITIFEDIFDISGIIIFYLYYYMYWFFVYFILAPISFVSSIIFIANFIYQPMLLSAQDSELKFEDDEYDENDYIYKYYDEFDALLMRDLLDNELNDLKNKIINEKTPKGDIILFYNNDTDTFFYYCNTKEIPYKYLETVARHYVCLHNCKQIYNDSDDNYLKKFKKEDKENKEEKEEKEVKEVKEEKEENSTYKSVFASFMSYNTENVKIKKENQKKVNRYTYKGKLDDYNNLEFSNLSNDEDVVKVDFTTYKKMMNKNISSNVSSDVSNDVSNLELPVDHLNDNTWRSWIWTSDKKIN